MLQTRTLFKTSTSRSLRHLYSTTNGSSNFKPVPSVPGPFTTLNPNDFRDHAFTPEKPLFITANREAGSRAEFPAAKRWFTPSDRKDETGARLLKINTHYLDQFSDTILPYELISPSASALDPSKEFGSPAVAAFLKTIIENSEGTTFHRFSAPLSLFLLAANNMSSTKPNPQLYIAQAQIIDLPPVLRADLPTPNIVLEAGKGDVYDANIWLGIPPTYTPLHKDPNPNLFVQMARKKVVRILKPDVGRAVFADVRSRMGETGREGMRGVEMMEGVEKELLHEAVWGVEGEGEEIGSLEGFEATVGPMDALFIPKGWWHSIRSVGKDVNASVNWWFR
jgi:hypothetical protein